MTAEPTANPSEPESQRPDLHIVRATDTDPAEEDTAAAAEVKTPPETPAETTGPVPVVDADGQVVAPQAPLDVRIRNAVQQAIAAIPALSERPASFRESLEYSQRGDWTANDNAAKRVVHGLATLVTYLVTYLPVDLLGRARTKPIGFVLSLVLVITVANIVT